MSCFASMVSSQSESPPCPHPTPPSNLSAGRYYGRSRVSLPPPTHRNHSHLHRSLYDARTPRATASQEVVVVEPKSRIGSLSRFSESCTSCLTRKVYLPTHQLPPPSPRRLGFDASTNESPCILKKPHSSALTSLALTDLVFHHEVTAPSSPAYTPAPPSTPRAHFVQPPQKADSDIHHSTFGEVDSEDPPRPSSSTRSPFFVLCRSCPCPGIRCPRRGASSFGRALDECCVLRKKSELDIVSLSSLPSAVSLDSSRQSTRAWRATWRDLRVGHPHGRALASGATLRLRLPSAPGSQIPLSQYDMCLPRPSSPTSVSPLFPQDFVIARREGGFAPLPSSTSSSCGLHFTRDATCMLLHGPRVVGVGVGVSFSRFRVGV
ncbi:hypothetical protein R3P38DRAFT_619998 [Favolaschia claudopus]|uniref:Uncharacterized protein n=1 Tax=Favolaschia claudopus TaxID=2862362 RepID=A0AAW0CE34_9AGAR